VISHNKLTAISGKLSEFKHERVNWISWHDKDGHRTPVVCRQTKLGKLQISSDMEKKSKWFINKMAWLWRHTREPPPESEEAPGFFVLESHEFESEQNHQKLTRLVVQTTHKHVWKAKSNQKLLQRRLRSKTSSMSRQDAGDCLWRWWIQLYKSDFWLQN